MNMYEAGGQLMNNTNKKETENQLLVYLLFYYARDCFFFSFSSCKTALRDKLTRP